MVKTDTGHASRVLRSERQKRVRVFCAERGIYQMDFAELAKCKPEHAIPLSARRKVVSSIVEQRIIETLEAEHA